MWGVPSAAISGGSESIEIKKAKAKTNALTRLRLNNKHQKFIGSSPY